MYFSKIKKWESLVAVIVVLGIVPLIPLLQDPNSQIAGAFGYSLLIILAIIIVRSHRPKNDDVINKIVGETEGYIRLLEEFRDDLIEKRDAETDGQGKEYQFAIDQINSRLRSFRQTLDAAKKKS